MSSDFSQRRRRTTINRYPQATRRSSPPEIPSLRRDAVKKARFNPLTHVDYYAYTREFDETIDALSMPEAAEADYLASRLSKLKLDCSVHPQHAKYLLAASLQRLSAGDVAVSFLIDNSGSMRGEKIARIVCWISDISSVLSGLGIAHEVLGFTTRAWIGGRSRALWISDGKPPFPGRLNDLRHIVYKSFEDRSDLDRRFALMLSPAILRENIDGEALLWAHSRLCFAKQTRKILVVISDGAPRRRLDAERQFRKDTPSTSSQDDQLDKNEIQSRIIRHRNRSLDTGVLR